MKSNKNVSLDCGKLRIEWQRAEDRWQHVVGLMVQGNFCALIRSIEGVSDDLWPMSPTLQEIHVESRGDGSVAFLTGMAGTSHWSASVLCESQLGRATFDIACRCKEKPEWLGSLYQTPEWLEVRHSPQLIAMSLPHEALRVVARTSDLIGSVPQFTSQQNQRGEFPWTASFVNRVNGFRRTIFVAPQWSSEDGKRTIQWKYTLETVG